MPFTDEQPFLDAIAARYSDDGPRLLYADFLDDAGEHERAELIRIQITLARLREAHPRIPELAEREAELHLPCSAHWKEQFGELVEDIEFRRGVPHSISVNAASFLESGEQLFRVARIRRIRLLGVFSVLPQLIESPLLSSVRELDLCGEELGNSGLLLLIRSPFLTELEALDLGFNGLDDAGIIALAAASTLVNLTSLSLNDNKIITSVGIAAIAESPFFAGLTVLDLSGNSIDSHGVRALTAVKVFPRLHSLRLKGNPIEDDGLGVLLESPLFGRMVERSPRVELRDNDLGPDGATLLANCLLLAGCTALDLTGNFIGDRGFAALMTSPHLGAVHTLRLGGNQITDAGVTSMRRHLPALLARLRVLDLSENRLTKYGIGVLLASRGESGVEPEVSGNVQSANDGEPPVAVGEVMPDVLRNLAEAAELRRRISNPRMLPRS
ncbi:MAG: TIGR02996 domain-containing protein [Gemmataceae bacterium]